MQIAITFGDHATELSPAAGARIMADVNGLVMMSLALAAGLEPPASVVSPRYGALALMERGPDGIGYAQLVKVEFGSPFKIVTAIFDLTERLGSLRQVWNGIEEIVMFRNRRERLDAETALIRQQALSAEIANVAKLMELIERVPSQAERERLLQALTSGIGALIDDRHPKITELKIVDGADRPSAL